MSLGRFLLLSPLAIWAIACGFQEGADTQTRVVSDSSGVELVLLDPLPEAVPQWATAENPGLEIGKISDDGAEEFFRVTGAALLSGGRVVVGHRGTSELRLFDARGEFLRSFGGEGEGPGEFRDINFLGRLPGDTIVVQDRSLRRVSLFDPESGFIRSQPFPGTEVAPFQIVGGILARGAVVSWSAMKEPPQTPGVHTTTETIGVFDMETGESTPITSLTTMEEGLGLSRGRLLRTYPPFGRKSDVVAGGDLFYVLQSNDDRSIEVYDAFGELIRVLRVNSVREEADREAVTAWIESLIEQAADGSEEMAANLRMSFEGMPSPDHIPVFRSLEVDTNGNVCAEQYPHTFDSTPFFWCFSPDGFFLRTIRLSETPPRGLHPFHDAQLEIGEDYVLGVWEDGLGMEYVRKYPLVPVG